MKKKKLDSGTHLLMYFTSRDNRRNITCMADETQDKNNKKEKNIYTVYTQVLFFIYTGKGINYCVAHFLKLISISVNYIKLRDLYI